MNSIHLLLSPIYLLLLGVVLQLLLPRTVSPRTRGWGAFFPGLGAFIAVISTWPSIANGQAIEATLFTWDGPFSLSYHVDGLSLLFALMATGIGMAIVFYSIEYMQHDPGTLRFYSLVLLFIAGLVHLVYAADLIALYLSWEIIGLCSFLLVGFWFQKEEAARGARKVLLMTHLAGYGLLAGIIILFCNTGTSLWTDPLIKEAMTGGVFFLIVLAALAKSVQFPLHTWISDAMAAPTPVSALLHAACYVKAGVYLVARMHSLGVWPQAWSQGLLWLGTITLLVGGLFAIIQTDLKRLLAFSTVSQIGYMMLGLGLGTPLGIAAGLLHCLNHGLFKAGLFMGAGAIQHAAGTRDMNLLGGLSRKMPVTTSLWLLNAASIAGLPLMSGFASKWMLYNAGLEVGAYAPVLIAWLVSIVTVFYFLKASTGVFFGEPTPAAQQAHDPGRHMRWSMGFLAAGSLLLGIAPQLGIGLLINPILLGLGMAPIDGLSWLGLNLAAGSWWTTVGLALALVAAGFGALIYRIGKPARLTPNTIHGGGIFTGGEPLTEMGRIPASDFSAMIKTGFGPFYKFADVDFHYLNLWKLIRSCAKQAERFSRWLEKRAILFTLLIGLGLGIIGTIVLSGKTISEANTEPPISGLWLAGIALAWIGLSVGAWVSDITRKKSPVFLLCGALVMIALLQTNPFIRLLLLESASLAALFLVWKTNTNRSAALSFLVAIILSAGCLLGAHFLRASGNSALAGGLYIAGFAIKLALIPLYFWLPGLAEATPALVIGLITAVVDMSAFSELWQLRQSLPYLFSNPAIWFGLALLSSLGGALLMLGQRDLKRFLAFSSIEDLGYLIAGITAGGQWGIEGAWFGALTHMIAKALLFFSLAWIEKQSPLTLDRNGMAQKFPISAVAFLLGMLSMLGVPPLLGFVGRWRLYTAIYQSTPLFLWCFLLASGLALLAYVRIFTAFWWNPNNEKTHVAAEPPIFKLVIWGLGLALLAGGIAPGLLPLLARVLGG